MREGFVLLKGVRFEKVWLGGGFGRGDEDNKMVRGGVWVVEG